MLISAQPHISGSLEGVVSDIGIHDIGGIPLLLKKFGYHAVQELCNYDTKKLLLLRSQVVLVCFSSERKTNSLEFYEEIILLSS